MVRRLVPPRVVSDNEIKRARQRLRPTRQSAVSDAEIKRLISFAEREMFVDGDNGCIMHNGTGSTLNEV